MRNYDDIEKFINAFWSQHYHSPTMREISAGVGIPSTSHTWYIIRKMSERGVIVYNHTSRSIVPLWVKTAIETAAGVKGL